MPRKSSTLNLFNLLTGLLLFSRKHPVTLLIILILGLGAYGYEVKITGPALLYQGAPQAISAKNSDTWFRIVRNQGYILGDSDVRGN